MRRLLTSLVLTVVFASTARAQQPGQNPAAKPGQPDPLGQFLYPPELIMQHQQEIRLLDTQRAAIQKELQTAQSKFMDVQWKMSAEVEKLGKLLQATTADEAQTLEQIDRILTLEREVKKAQILLMVRIKNSLTAPQQEKLTELKKAMNRGLDLEP